MRIELVGGPKCGEVVTVKHLQPLIVTHDIEGIAVNYSRRDKPVTLSSPAGGCYGVNGYRMYDYVKGYFGHAEAL